MFNVTVLNCAFLWFCRLIKKLEHTWKALVHDGVSFNIFLHKNTGSQMQKRMCACACACPDMWLVLFTLSFSTHKRTTVTFGEDQTPQLLASSFLFSMRTFIGFMFGKLHCLEEQPVFLCLLILICSCHCLSTCTAKTVCSALPVLHTVHCYKL